MNHFAPLYPPALKKGDTIGVIAPSNAWDVKKLQPAIDFLTQSGFKVVMHPQTALKHNQFAGTADDKVNAIHDYFADSCINAIFCTCGGNGALHYLDKIDYNLIKQNPKIFMGFSDITVLLNAIYKQAELVTFHGPTLTRIGKIEDKWQQQMLNTLTGKSSELIINAPNTTIEGALIGGNLSVLQALIGTSYAPPLDKAILLIEDVNDHFSRYDRMLAHMKQAGWFNNLSGILVGEFINSHDNEDRPFGLDIKDMLALHAPNIPVVYDIPVGHGNNLATLPIGADVVLKNGKLSFKNLS